MSRRPLFKVALVLLGFAAIVAAAQSGGGTQPTADASPAVLAAVAPDYPPAAWRVRAMGTIYVEVKVDGAGVVTSAEYVGGHPMLKETSLSAARRWRFASAPGAKELRTARLAFLFEDSLNERPAPRSYAENDRVIFRPPYTVEVIKGSTPVQY